MSGKIDSCSFSQPRIEFLVKSTALLLVHFIDEPSDLQILKLLSLCELSVQFLQNGHLWLFFLAVIVDHMITLSLLLVPHGFWEFPKRLVLLFHVVWTRARSVVGHGALDVGPDHVAHLS